MGNLMADFSLLSQPNFGQAALAGYSAGAKIGKQRQLDTAMAGVDLDNPASLLPIFRADPTTGAALIGASVKLHAENRAQQAQAALGDALGGYFGGGSAPSSGSSGGQGALMPPAITAAPTPANPLAPSATPASPAG